MTTTPNGMASRRRPLLDLVVGLFKPKKTVTPQVLKPAGPPSVLDTADVDTLARTLCGEAQGEGWVGIKRSPQ